ncbi:MAG TPA: mannose-1-phosphate guanylyltransferase/mannose-6-phosphate isomerase [Alphaproteobacteria bacterium]|nr:mannose-1-phosphate guanylyltransferase/mannose-6-phosphate isomerase [Alphaproteobacteria bacterium]
MIIKPVILSGGSGTRLWPVSRQRVPKQFVPLLGPQCLFEATLASVNAQDFAAPIIVGNAEHKFLILDILERATKDAVVLLEPCARNTAAAAIAAALEDEFSEDVLHLVRPSDHVIRDETAFYSAVESAMLIAGQGHFVLFGVTPDYAETGYGYISPGRENNEIRPIASFHEKPEVEVARALIKDGALWNSGIFLYPPQLLLHEAERLAPELLAECRAARAASHIDLDCVVLGEDAYIEMPSAPFDRAIMEHTKRGKVISCNMGWSDVGSWQALWQLAEKNENQNVCEGPVTVQDTSGCLIRSEGPTVAALGLKDMTVVATKDAVLIAPRESSQDIRHLVEDVSGGNASLTLEHPRMMRPWGWHEGLAQGPNFQVKQITVKPGGALSLQMHKHRAEHWVVVHGTAQVECDGVITIVHPNEAAYIPRGSTHRLSNAGEGDLYLIEIQCGDYLGEDDIVRFEDHYGRAAKAS